MNIYRALCEEVFSTIFIIAVVAQNIESAGIDLRYEREYAGVLQRKVYENIGHTQRKDLDGDRHEAKGELATVKRSLHCIRKAHSSLYRGMIRSTIFSEGFFIAKMLYL